MLVQKLVVPIRFTRKDHFLKFYLELCLRKDHNETAFCWKCLVFRSLLFSDTSLKERGFSFSHHLRYKMLNFYILRTGTIKEFKSFQNESVLLRLPFTLTFKPKVDLASEYEGNHDFRLQGALKDKCHDKNLMPSLGELLMEWLLIRCSLVDTYSLRQLFAKTFACYDIYPYEHSSAWTFACYDICLLEHMFVRSLLYTSILNWTYIWMKHHENEHNINCRLTQIFIAQSVA